MFWILVIVFSFIVLVVLSRMSILVPSVDYFALVARLNRCATIINVKVGHAVDDLRTFFRAVHHSATYDYAGLADSIDDLINNFNDLVNDTDKHLDTLCSNVADTITRANVLIDEHERLAVATASVVRHIDDAVSIPHRVASAVGRGASAVTGGVASAAAATVNAGADAVRGTVNVVRSPYDWAYEVYTNYFTYDAIRSLLVSHWIVITLVLGFLIDVTMCFLYMRKSSKDKIHDVVILMVADIDSGKCDCDGDEGSPISRESIASRVKTDHVKAVSQALFMGAAVLTSSFVTYRTFVANTKTVIGSRFNNKLVSLVDNFAGAIMASDEPVSSKGCKITEHNRFGALRELCSSFDMDAYEDGSYVYINLHSREIRVARVSESIDVGYNTYNFDVQDDAFVFRMSAKLRFVLTTPPAQVINDHYVTRALVVVVASATILTACLSTYFALEKINSLHKRTLQKIIKQAVDDYYADKDVFEGNTADAEFDVSELVREGKSKRTHKMPSGEHEKVRDPSSKQDKRVKQYDREVAEADKVSGFRSDAKYTSYKALPGKSWAEMADEDDQRRQQKLSREALAAKTVSTHNPPLKKEQQRAPHATDRLSVNTLKPVINREGAQLTSPALNAKTMRSIIMVDVKHEDGSITSVTGYVRTLMTRQVVHTNSIHKRCVSATVTVMSNDVKTTYDLTLVKCWSYVVMPGDIDYAATFSTSKPLPVRSLVFKLAAIPDGNYSGIIYSPLRSTASCGDVCVVSGKHITHKIDTQEGDSGSLIWIAVNDNGHKLVVPVGAHIGAQLAGNVGAPLSVIFPTGSDF